VNQVSREARKIEKRCSEKKICERPSKVNMIRKVAWRKFDLIEVVQSEHHDLLFVR